MTPEQSKRFKYWQWRTIIGTMIGYAVFYFVRKNFSFAIPGLTAEYGISKTTFGAIIAVVSLIYGISKLVNGFLADFINGRWHMVTGLSVSTVANVLFGAGAIISAYWVGTDSGERFTYVLVLLFTILLVVNNIFQGCGFPPCNRLITHWVPPHELATKMSIWNTSHSIGAFIAALLCGYIMGHAGVDCSADPQMAARIAGNLGDGASAERLSNALQHVGAWQWTFWIPAAIAFFGVIFIIVTLRDTPKSVGLPELGGIRDEAAEQTDDERRAHRRFLVDRVIKNPIVWILALGDFFVYIVRMAVLDWGPSFLQESRGLSPQMSAWTVAIFEVFGIAGMLASGVISDRLFKGRAQRTCVFCMLGVIVFIAGFCFLPASTNPVVLLFVLACAGFFLYGPQALIGVIASNQVTRRGASSANGIIGFVSYLSPIISGFVFGKIADNPELGWEGVFRIMILIALLGLVTMATLWNTKADGYEHDPAEKH